MITAAVKISLEPIVNLLDRFIGKLRFEKERIFEDCAILLLKRKLNLVSRASARNSKKNHFLLKVFVPRVIITLEGGIGQQFFTYLIGQYLKRKDIEVELLINLTQAPEHRYELELFGLKQQDFSQEFRVKSHSVLKFRVRLTQRMLFKIAPRALREIMELDLACHLRAENQISSLVIGRFKEKYGYEISEVVMLHLRRGDFVHKGVDIIGPTYYIPILQDVRRLFKVYSQDFKVFICTDSQVDTNEIESLRQSEIDVTVIENFTDAETHLLMQTCGVLICSNSSFSLSAAILRHPKNISFIPRKFYSGYHGYYFNMLITELFDYGLLKN